MTESKPRFLINPAVAALHWTPEVYQLVAFPNPRYLNSVWLGTVWNVVLLPTRIWHEVVRMAVNGHALFAVLHLFVSLPLTMLALMFAGLRGQLRAMNVPLELIVESRVLTPEEAMLQFNRQNYDLLTENRQLW